MKNQMFCFQCQETAMNSGCTVAGVCGKKAPTSAAMDMLLFATRGLSIVSTALRNSHVCVSKDVDIFVEDALFTTITNANFDRDAIMSKIHQGFTLRDQLLQTAKQHNVNVPEVDAVNWHGPISDYTIILTAGSAKYRYNKLNFKNVHNIPRVLDAGQCNDSYSLILTAINFKDALKLNDINELPIIYNIAWYEQKAVIVLLALLSLGVKNIHIGPTIPAFISPNVLKTLQEKFGLSTISTVEEDLIKFEL